MKTLVFLLVVVFTVSFAASANHNRRHGKRITTKNDETDLGAGSVEWPSPGTINEFAIPDEFTGGSGGEGEQDHGSGDEIPPARNHGKNHKRSHKN